MYARADVKIKRRSANRRNDIHKYLQIRTAGSKLQNLVLQSIKIFAKDVSINM